jgi:hypothetical protein
MIERALIKIWLEIKGESLLKLNESIGKRIAIVIENKGGSTKY